MTIINVRIQHVLARHMPRKQITAHASFLFHLANLVVDNLVDEFVDKSQVNGISGG